MNETILFAINYWKLQLHILFRSGLIVHLRRQKDIKIVYKKLFIYEFIKIANSYENKMKLAARTNGAQSVVLHETL